MSETVIDSTDPVVIEDEFQDNESSNTIALVLGGAIIGVAATAAAKFAFKKFKNRAPKDEETIHVVTDLEDKKSEEN